MSAYKELDELILRTKSVPPLTTKGAKLTWTEMDENFEKIYSALQGILNGANVPAYDAGAEYDFYSTDPAKKYARYNSRIWKAVYVGSPSGFTGQIPDEAGGYWEQISLAELLGNPITLTKIAEAFDNTKNPSAVYETDWISSTKKDLNSDPLKIADNTDGADVAYVPVAMEFQLEAGAAAYDFDTGGIFVAYDSTPTNKIITISQARINSLTDILVQLNTGSAVSVEFGADLILSTATNAAVGTGTYHVKVYYRKVQKQF